jgi:hypothetical protein
VFCSYTIHPRGCYQKCCDITIVLYSQQSQSCTMHNSLIAACLLAVIAGNVDDAAGNACAASQGTSQQVFASMKEVEAFWDSQARQISSVCAVDIGLARYLLKEHGHDSDRAVRAYLVHVRFQKCVCEIVLGYFRHFALEVKLCRCTCSAHQPLALKQTLDCRRRQVAMINYQAGHASQRPCDCAVSVSPNFRHTTRMCSLLAAMATSAQYVGERTS